MGTYSNRKYLDQRKCDACGKYHHIGTTYTYSFMTMDGGDNLSEDICLACEIKSAIKAHIATLKIHGKRAKFFLKVLPHVHSHKLLVDLWNLSKKVYS